MLVCLSGNKITRKVIFMDFFWGDKLWDEEQSISFFWGEGDCNLHSDLDPEIDYYFLFVYLQQVIDLIIALLYYYLLRRLSTTMPTILVMSPISILCTNVTSLTRVEQIHIP